MKTARTLFIIVFCLGLSMMVTGCVTCVKVRDIPPTSSAHQITQGNVVFTAALRGDGTPKNLLVQDYCPSKDGINEILVGSTESNAGGAAFATISFPPAAFGDGPKEVTVTCCHFNHCELKAYDRNGALVATAVHPGPQGVAQGLTLTGGNISRIDIIGTELAIDEVCYSLR